VPWHTLSVLAILAGHSIYGAMVAPSSNAPSPAPTGTGGSQVMSYIFMIGSEILLATWIWAGVPWKGGRIRDLIGGRGSNWRQVLRDFAIALPFWVIWETTARLVYALLYPHSSPSNAYHVPAGPARFFSGCWCLFPQDSAKSWSFAATSSANSMQQRVTLWLPLRCKRSSSASCIRTKVGSRCW
jgi:hypothetical protein